jgi:LPS-assembly protein
MGTTGGGRHVGAWALVARRRRLMMLRVLLSSLIVIASAAGLGAQSPEAEMPAMLIADNVFISEGSTLVAEGNVEAFQGDRRLKAQKITYDPSTEKMTIEGPIVLQDGTSTLILADAAELDRDLQNGLLTGARMVLDQQLQLAAAHISQTSGRYSQLYKTTATSCRVCENGSPPLWQIRARQVIHDDVEQQLYFDRAQFRVLNVPVFYLPRLRLPGPGLDRATGFLRPLLAINSQLSTGVKVPYFIKLGDHRDLTLTPYLSSKTRTLEYRYRQAFRRGRISFEGALSDDTLREGELRAYLFARGNFNLKRNYKLSFRIEATSDKAYLKNYDYSNADRLTSEIAISRTSRDTYFRAGLLNYYSLRDDVSNDTEPTIIGDVFYDRRFFPQSLGGELRVGLDFHSHYRRSDLDIDGSDTDSIVDGRDVTRLSSELMWLRDWTFGNGLRVDGKVGVAVDFFNIRQDVNYDSVVTEVAPQTALALSYPMIRSTGDGVVHYLEPVAQIAWVGGSSDNVPNDESTRQDFDEGNLLSLSRFPAVDRRERGVVAAYGVNWTRIDLTGWEARLNIGQVIREKANDSFTVTSGLRGTRSDFLVAGQLKTRTGLNLTARTLFDEGFNFSKAEIRTAYLSEKVNVVGSYVWLTADPLENRADPVSELAVASSFPLSRNWRARANFRYDIEEFGATRAGAGLIYRNECVEVDLSVQRRFTSSRVVDPSTTFGFTISMAGFSAMTGTKNYSRSCGKQAK